MAAGCQQADFALAAYAAAASAGSIPRTPAGSRCRALFHAFEGRGLPSPANPRPGRRHAGRRSMSPRRRWRCRRPIMPACLPTAKNGFVPTAEARLVADRAGVQRKPPPLRIEPARGAARRCRRVLPPPPTLPATLTPPGPRDAAAFALLFALDPSRRCRRDHAPRRCRRCGRRSSPSSVERQAASSDRAVGGRDRSRRFRLTDTAQSPACTLTGLDMGGRAVTRALVVAHGDAPTSRSRSSSGRHRPRDAPCRRR